MFISVKKFKELDGLFTTYMINFHKIHSTAAFHEEALINFFRNIFKSLISYYIIKSSYKLDS